MSFGSLLVDTALMEVAQGNPKGERNLLICEDGLCARCF